MAVPDTRGSSDFVIVLRIPRILPWVLFTVGPVLFVLFLILPSRLNNSDGGDALAPGLITTEDIIPAPSLDNETLALLTKQRQKYEAGELFSVIIQSATQHKTNGNQSISFTKDSLSPSAPPNLQSTNLAEEAVDFDRREGISLKPASVPREWATPEQREILARGEVRIVLAHYPYLPKSYVRHDFNIRQQKSLICQHPPEKFPIRQCPPQPMLAPCLSYIYPNIMPCTLVPRCVVYHDQNPRMFAGFTEANKVRLQKFHVLQVYSDMPNYYPKPVFYDFKQNPMKFLYMITNYENLNSPHLKLWVDKWWVGDLFANRSGFEAFHIVSSTEQQSTVPFNYYVHLLHSGIDFESMRKPNLDQKHPTVFASYLASHPGTDYNRESIARELERFVRIAAFGKSAFNAPIKPTGCHDAHWEHDSMGCLVSHYRFHLAFENSIANDYVTEKLYIPLLVGTIPVYKGAPNVARYVPPWSIIRVDDFPTIEQLASYLQCLVQTPRLYHFYTNWRNRTSPFWEAFRQQPHPLCKTCQLVLQNDPILSNVSSRIPQPLGADAEADRLQLPLEECLHSSRQTT